MNNSVRCYKCTTRSSYKITVIIIIIIIGHTLRKEDGEVPKATILWNAQGSRKRGRPKTSWRRSVTKEVGRSWNELRFLAADR